MLYGGDEIGPIVASSENSLPGMTIVPVILPVPMTRFSVRGGSYGIGVENSPTTWSGPSASASAVVNSGSRVTNSAVATRPVGSTAAVATACASCSESTPDPSTAGTIVGAPSTNW